MLKNLEYNIFKQVKELRCYKWAYVVCKILSFINIIRDEKW